MTPTQQQDTKFPIFDPSSSFQQSALVEAQSLLFASYSASPQLRKSHSCAIINSTDHTITVPSPRGVHFQSMGATKSGLLNLEWYEALYLYEIGALKIDTEDVYNLIKDDGIYAVYKELKGLGYFVMAPTRSNNDCLKPQEDMLVSRTESLLGFGRRGHSFTFARDGLAVFTMNDQETFRRIRIVPRIPLKSQISTREDDLVDFNVYIPRKKFKKTNPGVADFRVIVKGSSDVFLSLGEQRKVFDGRGGDVKLAIVGNGMVSFLSLSTGIHQNEGGGRLWQFAVLRYIFNRLLIYFNSIEFYRNLIYLDVSSIYL
jgi:hypothetical protein